MPACAGMTRLYDHKIRLCNYQLQHLASNPRPPGCLKVKSAEGVWRIRVGDWRIGYEIDDSIQEVVVIRVGHRSEFYQ